MELFFLLTFAILQFFLFEKIHIEVKVFHKKNMLTFSKYCEKRSF